MLGAIHRAVLDEGPPQLRAFFTLDSSNLRRSSRYNQHGKQLECNFGSKPLDTLKISILGLCRVYNMLPARVINCKSVRSFQGALQQLLCSQAVLEMPNWQELLSPRWPIQQHPFRSIGYCIDNDRRAPLRPAGALPKPHRLACVLYFVVLFVLV